MHTFNLKKVLLPLLKKQGKKILINSKLFDYE